MNARVLAALSLSLASCGEQPMEPAAAARPSAAHFALECETRSVFAWNADRTLVPGNRVRCVAHVGDRLGAPVSGARVSFLSEAGSLSVAEGITDGGVLETELVVRLPEPLNVAPGTFSFSGNGVLVPAWMGPRTWLANPSMPSALLDMAEPRRADPMRPDAGLDNNPRDHLVTLIAVVEGEEAFDDDNANAFRDAAEAFIDSSEPFVDADDDGARGPNEPFVDGNGNGTWDGKNRSWDSAAQVWSLTHVLWTGLPAAIDVAGPRPSVMSATVLMGCNTSPCSAHVPLLATVSIADPWFNGISRTRSTDGCRVVSGDPRLTATLAFGPDVLGPEATVPATLAIALQDERITAGAGRVTVNLRCDYTDLAGTTRGFEFTAVQVDLQ